MVTVQFGSFQSLKMILVCQILLLIPSSFPYNEASRDEDKIIHNQVVMVVNKPRPRRDKWFNSLQRSVLRGGSKVDSCTSKLCSEVVNVSGQENGGSEEKSSGDGGSGGLSCGGGSDDTIVSDDLDSFDVRAGRLVRVVDLHLGFALSGGSVKSFAHFVDFAVSSAAQASNVDNGGLGVGQRHTVVDHLEDFFTLVSLDGACVVTENTKADFSSLVGTVRSDVVLGFLVVVVVVAVSVVVLEFTRTLAFFIVHLQCTASDQIVEVHVVASKITAAVVHVLVLHLLHVSSDVSLHVNKVVSVVGVASLGVSRSTRVGRAHAVSDKALGHDLDVVFTFGVVVPLLDVVASLELNTVSGNVAGVDVIPVDFVVVTLVGGSVLSVLGGLTRVLNQSASSVGIDRDVTGVGHDQREGENSNASEHVVWFGK